MLIEPLGVYEMLLLTAALLGGSAFLTQVAHVRESRRSESAAKAKAKDDGGKKAAPAKKGPEQGPFGMVAKYRYLTLLAAFSLLFTLVNTNGEYILGSIVSAAADAGVADGTIEVAKKKEWLGAFFASFYFFVNVLTVLLQSFVVSRIVKFGGLRLAFFVFPVVAFCDAAAIALVPVLMVARIGKTLENSSDYSVNNTVRNMLWLPTTRQMKYQAKQAVDTFFVRMGDLGSGVLVFVLAGVLHFGVRAFALSNLVLIGAVLWICREILREQEVLRKMKERGELVDESEASP